MREPTAIQTTVVSAALVALALVLAVAVAVAPVPGLAAGDAGTPGSGSAAETTTASEPTPPEARLVARFPAENGSMVERTVVSAADVARVDPPVNDSRTGAWTVTMALTDDGAARFTNVLVDTGFVDHPNRCPATEGRNDDGYCLLLVVDDAAISSFSLAPSLAQDVRSGAFAADPRLRLLAENRSEARAVWRGFLDETGPRTVHGTRTADGTRTIDGTGETEGDGGEVDTAGSDDAGTGASAAADGSGTDSSVSTPGFDAAVALAALLVAAVTLVHRSR